jgi:HSP20 family protein
MNVRDLIPWNRTPGTQAPTARPNEAAHPFLTLHREMNRLFDDVFTGFGAVPSLANHSFGWPHVELVEADGGLRLSAELPGLDEKDVELLVEDGVLTLRGEKRAENIDTARGYSERSYGRFERVIALPFPVEEEKAEAAFRNGVLTVTLPRSEKTPERGRRIAINSGGNGAPKTAH